jgi:hypothetical protein
MSNRRCGQSDESRTSFADTRPFIAVHEKVQSSLRKWSTSQGHSSIAMKIGNLMQAIIREEQDTINAILRQLAVEKIYGCKGLLELGPKQSKGGAARVFLYRKFSGAFFIDADVEKGSRGINNATAKGRVAEIEWIFNTKPRKEAQEAIKEKYEIIVKEDSDE